MNAVSLSGSPIGTVEFEARALQVTHELSDQFPFNLNYNSGFPLGIGVSCYFCSSLHPHTLAMG
jgi:hypothetical protein